FQLSRLFHYCSAQNIEPTDVDDDVMAQFYRALVEESIVRLPWEIYRGAAKNWNHAVASIRGWPQQRITVPSKQEQRLFSLPWDSFPPTLVTDVDAYIRRAAGLDLA